MKKVFYVWYASAQENQAGHHKKSHSFDSLKEAQEWGREMLEAGNPKKDFMMVEEVEEYIGEGGHESERVIAMYYPLTDGTWQRVEQ